MLAGSAAAGGHLHHCLSPGVCSEAPHPCSVPGSDLLGAEHIQQWARKRGDAEPLLPENPRTFSWSLTIVLEAELWELWCVGLAVMTSHLLGAPQL